MKHGLCLVLVLLMGCASLTPERVDALIAIAGQAAQIGTQIWLDKHPAPVHRQTFDAVVVGATALRQTGSTNMAEYAALLNILPIATLDGPEGAVDIRLKDIVIRDKVTDKSYAATMEMVRATVAGMKRGMAPAPPRMPSRARRVPGLPSTNDAPLSDAELDAQFAAIKAALASRTNIVSTVDVQPTPNGASIVTVRWQGDIVRAGAYRIEHRDEGAVDWMLFGEVGSDSVTGRGSWSTPWHPALPLGHWRVVRVK